MNDNLDSDNQGVRVSEDDDLDDLFVLSSTMARRDSCKGETFLDKLTIAEGALEGDWEIEKSDPPEFHETITEKKYKLAVPVHLVSYTS